MRYLIALVLLAGCAASPDMDPIVPRYTVTTEADTNWYSENQHLVSGISDALEELTTAAGNYDMDAVVAGCYDLDSAVELAQTADPIPDDSTNRHWQNALDYFSQAADSCIDGDIDTAGDLIGLGGDELELAADALG